jgi:Zn-dependent protease
MELLIGYIISAIILLFSVVIHEVAHGSVANALGDDTAQSTGRLSLNPLSHIDPVGSILVPGFLILTSAPFLFGWAKPVPVNFSNLRDYWGELKVAIAGPLVNIILALVFCLFIRFGFLPDMRPIFELIASMNIFLALFNLTPIYPLDGSHVIFNLLPDTWNPVKEFIVNYGLILLIILFIYPGFGSTIISWLAELFIRIFAGI